MTSKIVQFPKTKIEKTNTEVAINDLTDSDLLSFLKVCRALRDIGFSKNATIRVHEDELYVDVEYYAEVTEGVYTDSGALYKKTSAMDLLPLNSPDVLNDEDAINGMKELVSHLDIKEDFTADID